jgi:NAD(P)-dependent dehydrogenase (short-subunit alcohol dehydrogenase family)
VVGYAYASPHRSREAYRWAIEVSAYVDEEHRGRGLGGRLYDVLLDEVRALGLVSAYAGITLPNEASVALHEGRGFSHVGTFPRAGFKHGKWHDVGWWYRALTTSTDPPEAPRSSPLASRSSGVRSARAIDQEETMDTTRHAGKTAIVTGAGSGIGRATAVRLAGEGASVIGCDVAEAGLEATREAVEATGGTIQVLRADVTAPDDVAAVLAAAGGQIDILANVAGIMDHFLPLDEVDDATWDRVLAVNVTGVMRMTRAALPVMTTAGRGSVVTVASEASLGAGASGASYTTSKHAVIGLVRHVAFFYGPKGIRSNAVLPGGVETGIGTTADPHSAWAIERAQAKMATMGPTAQPDQIATVISWLACDEASNVNGALVTSDGGWSAA